MNKKCDGNGLIVLRKRKGKKKEKNATESIEMFLTLIKMMLNH